MEPGGSLRTPIPVPSQMNPLLRVIPSHFVGQIVIPSCLCLGLSSRLFPSGFPTKNLCIFFVSYLSATRPSYDDLPMDSFLSNMISFFISTCKFFSVLFKITFLLMPDLRGDSFRTYLLTLILSTLLILPYVLYVFPSTSSFIILLIFDKEYKS